jgi:hypothetical protein
MAQRNLLAIDNSDLAGRSGARFRAPLTMIGDKSPLHSLTYLGRKSCAALVLHVSKPLFPCSL